MFPIAHFIPPKSKSAVKTVFVSSDNDFTPLRRYISRIHNLFIKEVTNKKTVCTHVKLKLKLKRLYWQFAVILIKTSIFPISTFPISDMLLILNMVWP